jgi:hypothetical protein
MLELDLSKKAKILYINKLINRIYKILPIAEENDNKTPKLYVERLMKDINSANSLFDDILIDIIIKLNVICERPLEHQELKSIIFESIDIVKKIKEVI